MPDADRRALRDLGREGQRLLRRHVDGHTSIAPGGVHILVDATSRTMRRPGTAAVLLAHELIHAHQLGRPGVRDLMLAALRHNLGVSMDNGLARRVNRLVDQHEGAA